MCFFINTLYPMLFAVFTGLILFKFANSYSYSYSHFNYGYSDYFASDYFASDYFASNYFASNYFASDYFASGYSNLLASSSMNYLTMVSSLKEKSGYYHYSLSTHSHIYSSMNYLTMVLSFKEKSSHHHYSLSNTCQMPSHNPSPIPSPMPSPIPSPMPSFNPDQPLIIFESTLSLSGLTKPELDDTAQLSIIIAMSHSMNISTNFVKFISQKLLSQSAIQSFYRLFQSQSYTIVAVIEVTIPLSKTDNPTSIYTSLKNKLLESVGNGNFNTFLVAASIALNSTSTQNAVLLGIEITDPVQDLKSDSSKKYNAKYLRIFLITVFSLIGIVVLGIFSIVLKKKCRMNCKNEIQLIDLIELNQIQITD